MITLDSNNSMPQNNNDPMARLQELSKDIQAFAASTSSILNENKKSDALIEAENVEEAMDPPDDDVEYTSFEESDEDYVIEDDDSEDDSTAESKTVDTSSISEDDSSVSIEELDDIF